MIDRDRCPFNSLEGIMFSRCIWRVCGLIVAIGIVIFDGDFPAVQLSIDRDGQIRQVSNSRNRVLLRVVDSGNTPVANARIRVWGIDAYATPKRAILSDELGEAVVEIPDFRKSGFCVTARTSDGKAGFSEIHGLSFNLDEACTIKLKRVDQFTAVVVDYDTGDPIADCRVRVWYETPWLGIRVGAVDQVTGEDGKLVLDNLVRELHARIDTSCLGFHDFDYAPRIEYDVYRRNGISEPLQIALLSELSYQRILEAARLRIPDVSQMQPSIAFGTLAKHFERSKENRDHRPIGHWHSVGESYPFLGYMNGPQIGVYRELIWKIAQSIQAMPEPDNDTMFDAMVWLLTHGDDHSIIDSVKDHEVAAVVVDQFAADPGIRDVLLSIRSFHQDAETALEKIVRVNPDREVKVLALEQLVYLKSLNFSCFGMQDKQTDGLEQRQREERKHLERIAQEYGEIDSTYHQTFGQWANKRIAFLDQFAVGGTPPELEGPLVESDNDDDAVSLSDFRGRVVVIHYWPSSEHLDFADLKQVVARHPDRVQLLGITYGDREVAKRVLGAHKIDWPILWDWHKGILYRPIGDDPRGLQWGNEKANHFKIYSTIILDESGMIRAVGLRGTELLNFVGAVLDQ